MADVSGECRVGNCRLSVRMGRAAWIILPGAASAQGADLLEVYRMAQTHAQRKIPLAHAGLPPMVNVNSRA